MGTIRPKKPCAHPGCREWALPGRSYCAKHQAEHDAARKEAHERMLREISQARAEAQKEKDKRRGTAAARGYDSAWNRARKAYIIRHPLCAVCGAPATDVDHIKPHKGDKKIFWDSSNWQPLCHSCHAKKTYRENLERFQMKRKKEKPKEACITDLRMGTFFIP